MEQYTCIVSENGYTWCCFWSDLEDCENEKDGDDLMVNNEDLDEMYDMYVNIQPVESNSNNNKRKLSEEDSQTPSRKLKFISTLVLTFDSFNSGETFVFCKYASTQNKIASLNYPNYSNNSPPENWYREKN